MTQTYSGKYRAWRRAKDYLSQNMEESNEELGWGREKFFKVNDTTKKIQNEETSKTINE